ncbi:MAG: hypothetical protein H7328_01115 [Bdellovibrio sp.]|nr:hypothetical protein [Bdellovibrio sp.]
MKNIQEYITKSKVSVAQRKLFIAQFIDDFTMLKNTDSIQIKILGDDPVSKLFEAVAHQLCINLNLTIPAWLLIPIYLKDPFFVSDLPNSRFLALRDSPYAFRIRNIFAPYNYLSRC